VRILAIIFNWIFELTDVNGTDQAASDDPGELAFRKGEILEVLDRSGKWWEARRSDGRSGSTCAFLDYFSVNTKLSLYLFHSCTVELPPGYRVILN
jgi:hypothetical protein